MRYIEDAVEILPLTKIPKVYIHPRAREWSKLISDILTVGISVNPSWLATIAVICINMRFSGCLFFF